MSDCSEKVAQCRMVNRSQWHRRRFYGLISGILLLVILVLASLALGSRTIALRETFNALQNYNPQNDLHLIVRELRIPRTIVAVLAGLALGVAGAIMQAITRNPLAEPGLLGVNAGAAAAVVSGMVLFGLTSMQHYVWFAFIGAGLAGAIVFSLGQAHLSGTNPVRLVLAGAGLSIVLASVTGIIIVNSPLTVLDQVRHWSAGSVEGRGYDVAIILAVAVFIGLTTAVILAGNLNAITLGRDMGEALGVNIRLTWIIACCAVMLLAGAATAAAGPVGFAGLVAPHIARMMTGPNYRWILPYSALFSAILLLGADVVGRIIAPPSEIAAGIIITLIGGPFFIFVVRKYRLNKL